MTRTEQDCRRPDFRGGEPTVLGDGRTWYLPRPRVVQTLGMTADGAPHWARRADFGPDYDALLNDYAAAADGADDKDVTMIIHLMGYHLLRINYDIDLDDLARLLYWVRGDDPAHADNERVWDAVTAVALGFGPKRTPVG